MCHLGVLVWSCCLCGYTVKAKIFFLKYLMVSADVHMPGQHMGNYRSLHPLSSYSVSKPPSLPLIRDPGLTDLTHCQTFSSYKVLNLAKILFWLFW